MFRADVITNEAVVGKSQTEKGNSFIKPFNICAIVLQI